jgi:hypothetical protein
MASVNGKLMWWDCPACGGQGTLYKHSLTPPVIGGKKLKGTASEQIRLVINRQEIAIREAS